MLMMVCVSGGSNCWATDARKQRLLHLQEQYRQVEDLYLTFAKKAFAFNFWFEDAEEDLTDPVRCNSVEEIQVGGDGYIVPESMHSLMFKKSA